MATSRTIKQQAGPWLSLGAALLDWAWPWALLAFFLACNYGYHALARLSADPDTAARWLFQMGLAAEVVIGCCALLYLGRGKFKGARRIAFMTACLLGIIEHMQTVFCDGAAWGIWLVVANDETICHKEYGQWPYKVGLAFALSFLITRGLRKWMQNRTSPPWPLR